MREMGRDTPPSSIHEDELLNEDIEVIYMDEEEDDDEEIRDLSDGSVDFEMQQGEDQHPPKDDAVRLFNEHSGSVFCCNIHPGGKIAVTGGEDDKAYVWSVETGETINICAGHKDSVVIASFSFDGAYLATADMAGSIFVWHCPVEGSDNVAWSPVWEYQAEELVWGQWHPQAHVFICGTMEGTVYIFKIPSGETKVLQGDQSKSECGLLLPGGTTLASAYRDGSIKIWNLKTSTVLHHIIPETDLAVPILSMDVNIDGTLLIAASSYGKAFLTAIPTGKKVGLLDVGTELEYIACSKDPQAPFLATGTLEGDVRIWDTSKQMVRHTCSQNDDNSVGVTKMLWVKHCLITACLDGALRIYEGRSGDLLETLTGHHSEILDLFYSPSQNILLTTSDDNTARIFNSPTLAALA